MTAGVPVIVVTALGQIKDKKAALTSGALHGEYDRAEAWNSIPQETQ
ncbi:MAG: hypothetical protein ACHQ7N_02025 [Candidatus Methylomirabilales bacterium]